ncbi:MAG: ABC transporter permease/substrate-binding protein [Streptococcaceae bacterium]|jgi:osmoprotectant transport system permease protein|nr:ABC transporter permease/substrate-binding protein [Streptococcaceae bacterium]
MNLFQTFQSQSGNFGRALLEHIQISLLSLFVAILIAVPLALLLRRFPKTAEFFLQLTGIFQTIPSLALLGLMIPLVGIGTLPAVIALVVYALFPILQTTYTGLSQIDPSLEEAATAFGMNRREKLAKFEIAISLPFIMAGIRTSGIMIIGTATLAALIGAGGLGNFILLGINTNDFNLIIIGALSSALLAILFSLGLRVLEKARLRTIIVSLSALLLVLFGSFYQAAGNGNHPQITIAGKLGSEPNILINMYKDLIEENSTVRVTLKPNFGDTTFLWNALNSNKIDIYPEYTGTVTTTFLKTGTTSTNPETVYNAAKTGLKKKNLTYLAPMAFQDTFALAVSSDFAKKNGLTTISDLAKVQNQLTAGFDVEFNSRADGYHGLQSKYGLNFTVKMMQTSLIYSALNTHAINLAEVYSTDSQIKQYNLTVLKDDKALFPPYQAAPLMKDALLKKYPQLQPILNKLAGKTTEADMQQMNYDVAVKGQDAAVVAKNYLQKEGLLKK